MPSFHIMGTHLLTPWYKGSRRRRNVLSTQGFRRYLYEVPRCKGRQRGRAFTPSRSVSTKGVHGVWITMWMSDQCHAVPQHLTHCTIGRQHNPCNFIEMPFFGRNSRGTKVLILHDQEDSPGSSVQKCSDYQGELGWQDIAYGRSFHAA